MSSGRERAVPGRNDGADAHRVGVRHEDLRAHDLDRAHPFDPESHLAVPSAVPPHTDIDTGTLAGTGTRLICPTCAAPVAGDTEALLAALRASESRFRAAFADAAIGMALVDTEDHIIEANPAFAAMIGREVSELVRMHIHEIIDPEDTPRRLYLELVNGRRDRVQVEKRLKHREGRAVWSKVTISLIRDDTGRPMYTLAMVEDVTEQRRLGDRLAYQALHDPLTRLPNRTLFFERLDTIFQSVNGPSAHGTLLGGLAAEGAGGGGVAGDPGDRDERDDRGGANGTNGAAMPSGGAGRAVADRAYNGSANGAAAGASTGAANTSGGRVGLCYVDLDGFAAINETLGHHIGDQLLVAVAARLERRFARKPGQLVARLGGDEFAVLVADSQGSEQVTRLATELVEALEQPFELAGHQLAVTASVGVVERPIEGTTPTDLLRDADSTLYWSKGDGRARWTLYDADRGAHQLTRQLLATALRPALERGEFKVEYQPLVGLADGAVRGAEALVRWQHPRYGTLSPDRFIPLAEESGAIVPLGKWVLEESCRQAQRWLAEFPETETFVSVNLAARQIWDSDLVADVAQVLEQTGLPARLLQLEITESAVLGPGGRPLEALQALADMGVRIAIDDFGTGYSNLAYLSRLPVHVLKLDGTFIEGFRDAAPGRAGADEQIVGAMVQLAHALGLTVTAEGIESAAQAERLRLTGCDTAQGWYFARPGDAARVAAILRERRSR